MKSFLITFFSMMLVISAVAQRNPTFSVKTTPSEVIMISDGQRDGALGIVRGATPEMIKQVAPKNTFPMATNAFLIRTHSGKRILIDTGTGQGIFAGLQNLGVAPESIDAILLTHLHGDHIGGLLREGKVAFPNAKLMVPALEAQNANENTRKIFAEYNVTRAPLADGARAPVGPTGPSFEIFQPGILTPTVVYDNVKAMLCAGHTPGHTVYFIDNVCIWGDMTHAMAFQMPYPTVGISFDGNPQLAIASRQIVLRYLVDNNYVVGGSHVPYPGLGTLKSNGKGGYIFTPLSSR